MNHAPPKLTAPRLLTELPGPLARAMIEEDEQFTSPSYTRVYPLAVARGQGAVIEDLDGNRFLDFTAGIAVCSTGHCHPRVVEAIVRQSQQLLHMSGTDFYYNPQRDLARKLAEIAPCGQPARVFFTNSGAESVEAALKLARRHTGRPQVVAFRGAFHGRTMGAVSLTGSKAIQREGFSPLVPGVTHIEYPHCSRCSRQDSSSDQPCCLAGLDDLQRAFRQTLPPGEVAAIFVEPIQGEGGYIVPPPEFFVRLTEIARQHGILLVADEVQSGMGRTGKMFACQHWGFEPDIVCLAKGIASGMPLGAIVARDDVMDWPRGSHASTFGGNPVCCAAALATIELLETGLVDNAAEMGALLAQELNQLARRDRRIAEVRGRGLMVGVELVDANGAPDAQLCHRVVQDCFRRGLLLLSCGVSTVRFCPPLIVDAEQVSLAARLFGEALQNVRA